MTRIEEARRKAQVARNAIIVTAFGSFALFAGLARASHPAAQHAQSTSNVASVTDSYSYLGPAGSATPQVQSGGS